MRLRKHQREFSQVIDGIISGDPVRRIICKVTPGGGKSLIPILAGKLITAGLADAICWVCPRRSLQYQGERNFQDLAFREMLGHRLSIRASTNAPSPLRGLEGIITTYQAIGLDDQKTVLQDFLLRRYILILDEGHHVEQDGIWHQALAPIVAAAKFVIMMTGTMARGDEQRIAFLDYQSSSAGWIPVLEDTEDTRIIEYSRADALSEKAIIPLKFSLHDGHATWKDEFGKEKTTTLAKAGDDASKAIYTALSTEYAEELLGIAFEHWRAHRAKVPSSKFLVVTANLKHAKAAAAWMKARWYASEIATSHESEAAHKAIKRFKDGGLDILVSIAMASEGLDVPSVSHEAILTHVRSIPWIEQCICRAVRIDPAAGRWENQCGYIFAPDDPLFREIVRRIESDQLPIARKSRALSDEEEQLSLFDKAPSGEKRLSFTPLASRLTSRRELNLGGNGSGPQVQTPFPKTPSEIEQDLRESIERHVRLYEWNNRIQPPGKINREILSHFGKPRAEMTIQELEAVRRHVLATYPQNRIRGTGRPRVPTKAQVWTGPIQEAW